MHTTLQKLSKFLGREKIRTNSSRIRILEHTFSSRIFLKKFESSYSNPSNSKTSKNFVFRSPLFKPNRLSGTTRRDGTQRPSTDTSFNLLSIFDERAGNATMEPAPRETDRSIDARHLQTSPNGGDHNRTSLV